MAGEAEILVSGGVAAVLAAAVGGGLRAFGIELPLLASVGRQAAVFVVGIGLVLAGLISSGSLDLRSALPGTGNAAAEMPQVSNEAENKQIEAARRPASASVPPDVATDPPPPKAATPAIVADGEALLKAASDDDVEGVRRNLTHQSFGARAPDGMNALMIAADKCRMGIARYMLNSGALTRADIDARNAWGDTALEIARGTDSDLRSQGVTRQRCPALIPLLENFAG